jgi:hypothetical protein
MRKLITGASIFLIFLSAYVILRVVSVPHPAKLRSAIVVAATPTPNPDIQLASSTAAPAPIRQLTPVPTPVPKSTLEPLKSRVVNHQSDQFRKGAVGNDELVAIKKAIKAIPWSLNPNPEAAAKEDYSAIVQECEKSGEHDLLPDLIAEAVSNDYQPNNEAANAAYSNELNSDFENGHQSDTSNGKSPGETTTGQEASVDKALPPAVNEPAAASSSPASPPTPAENIRAGIVHVKHRSIVRHRIVDAKTRLLQLWHQSLVQTEKPSKPTLLLDPREGTTKSSQR